MTEPVDPWSVLADAQLALQRAERLTESYRDERNEAVRALAERGIAVAPIAQLLGITTKAVRTMIRHAEATKRAAEL
jgi:hypothetical protein